MNRIPAIGMAVSVVLAAQFAHAGNEEELIALDKKWGESRAGEVEKGLMADDLVALGEQGRGSKADMLREAETAETPEGPYEAGDYDVKFLGADVAVMTHSTGGEEPHWSMHVFHKQDGKWQVAATATLPRHD